MPISGYFDQAFANDGDLNTVPDAAQPSGSVSYNQGFPILYSTPVGSGGLLVPRTAFNQLFYDVTTAIQYVQQGNAAAFITSTMNGGTPYSYPAGAVVASGGVTYVSLVNSNTTTPPSLGFWGIVSQRTQLHANANYYVATTGSDSNPGTSGSPFATLQHAVNILYTLDLNGYTATVNVADGTYTTGFSCNGPFVGGVPQITGDVATPSNCIISTTNASCITASNNALVGVAGFKLQAATSGTGVAALTGSRIYINGPMVYGSIATTHLTASDDSQITITANYTINTSALATHWDAERFGQIYTPGITVTVSGSPTITNFFAETQNMGLIICQNIVFSGSAVGSRYSSSGNSVIDTLGGGPTYLPGSSTGVTATGGQYI